MDIANGYRETPIGASGELRCWSPTGGLRLNMRAWKTGVCDKRCPCKEHSPAFSAGQPKLSFFANALVIENPRLHLSYLPPDIPVTVRLPEESQSLAESMLLVKSKAGWVH
ncbi:hypothetical protein MIND_01111800 [Mycena indigotica]|uniref:Uncharacterized protein n=1 Tax=Mycena indigotica TaxID=2126181 RepID=A0A8H6SA95_9AGAR|nr:uncharacterized protein MIND_01111800 [Mycena indigotica]KAF7295714.1 hypothetical protein MIND_01111800 [Mycena indigotica]